MCSRAVHVGLLSKGVCGRHVALAGVVKLRTRNSGHGLRAVGVVVHSGTGAGAKSLRWRLVIEGWRSLG